LDERLMNDHSITTKHPVDAAGNSSDAATLEAKATGDAPERKDDGCC